MSFIASAFAQDAAAAAAQQPSALAGIMPILLILVVFYFLLIRPQQAKYKQHLAMVTAVAKGDTVVTSGGIVGKVTKVDAENDMLHVEIASGIEVKVIRSTISAMLDADGKPINLNAVAAKADEKKAPAKAKKTPAKKAPAKKADKAA